MGLPVSRQGDKNELGGAIERGAESVFCNGIPVGLHVSDITPYGDSENYGYSITTTASPDVICEGSPVLRITSLDQKGYAIIEGSENVVVS